MVSRVDDILRMNLYDEDEDEVDWVEYGQHLIGVEPELPTPYKRYGRVSAEERNTETRENRPPCSKGRDKDVRRAAGSTQSSSMGNEIDKDLKSSIKSSMKSTFNGTGTISDSGLSDFGSAPQIQISRRYKNNSADSLSNQSHLDSYSNAVRK